MKADLKVLHPETPGEADQENSPPSGVQWLTLRETADKIRVHRKTLYDWAAKGKVPAYKIGGTILFDAVEIDNFIKSNPLHRPRQPFDPKREANKVLATL